MTNPLSSETLRPTETLEIENGLSLVPRMKLLLTIHCADHSVKPLDEWHIESIIRSLSRIFNQWHLDLCCVAETFYGIEFRGS
ncbi:hypothetical protein LOK49_LG12G03060 [Camellia lanceoleosa]|uniref:Uncharacterized protein n=1 Tax=Camellia lanceoleosa TaxID=1840588 RepID=A0ACC0FWG6_9ERIC|nr:hypothetical protein LOK49_LG12G03060 [Camellia lanceoleosa]